MSGFAYISDAWGVDDQIRGPTKQVAHVQRKDPTCSLIFQESLNDDIMSTYLAEQEQEPDVVYKPDDRYLQIVNRRSQKQKHQVIDEESSCYNAEQITGFQSNPMLDYAYNYENFYMDNLVRDPQDHTKLPKECNVPVVRDKIVQNVPVPVPVKESFEENKQVVVNSGTGAEITDLMLYILAGVFLIFILEQIFNLGAHLKKK